MRSPTSTVAPQTSTADHIDHAALTR